MDAISKPSDTDLLNFVQTRGISVISTNGHFIAELGIFQSPLSKDVREALSALNEKMKDWQ